MKASEIKKRAPYIDIEGANSERKNLCNYLKTLGRPARDIFHGNYDIDTYDEIFLEDVDHEKAFISACAVVAYRVLNIYGANCEIYDDCIFPPFSFKGCADGNILSFMCSELAYEYGRQLHYIIALRAQQDIENDLMEE